MSWIVIIWSMAGATCLTLAGMQILVWSRVRGSWENLFFALAAIAAGATAFLELQLMYTQTASEYGEALRWIHVSVATIIFGIVWFVRLYLRAGRIWLAWSIIGLRVLLLTLNFLMLPNATFQEITSLRSVTFMGEMLSIPIGETNPWRFLAPLSSLLLVIYVLDASFVAWRQGKHRQSAVLGGSIFFAAVLGIIFSDLMTRGILPGPLIGLVFLLIVLAMAFELSLDLIRTKQLSQELGESQARMSLAARAASLSLWEWDMSRDEIWANDTGRARIGANDIERIHFERAFQFVHPDDCESTREAVRHALDNGEEFQAEFRTVTPDGATRWVVARGQVERNPKGDPIRLRGVSMDITERKQAEAEFEKLHAELAHVQRVSAMGQLSSSLAHEINQPLGAILRNSEAAELFLKQNPPDLDELRAILVDIRQDEQRAASVIERMRSLLKRRELQFEALAVDQLIEQVTMLLHAEVQMRHATLLVEVPREFPRVRGDRVHLQQVILNLLLNSLDASDSQSNAQRGIVVRATQTETGMVELAVIDRGTGIPADVLPHLLEPFITTKSKGTGLGLAISKTIVEMHGGQISGENNPDGGATFRFTLQVAEHGGAS